MALLVALMVTSQVAITIFLPSLPSMAGDLGTSQALVQMTVSAYLGAFAIAQLVVGPISDAIGRRKPLIAGLILFTLGSIACAAAPTIDILIGARMAQAIGGCACLVVGRAIVRDTTDGAAATRAMAYLGMSLAVAPMLAPLLGGQLETAFGWQSNFLFTALLGGLTLIATIQTLEETLPMEARRLTNTGALARTYLRLSMMGKFMGYSFCTAAMGAAFQAFLAGAPFALIVVMDVPPEQLGYFIMAVPIGYIIGNYHLQPDVPAGLASAHDLDRRDPGGGGYGGSGPPATQRYGLALHPDHSTRFLFLWVRLCGAQQSGRGADRRRACCRRIGSRAGGICSDGRRVRKHHHYGVTGPDILPAGGHGDVLVLRPVPAGLRAAGGATPKGSYGLNASAFAHVIIGNLRADRRERGLGDDQILFARA